MKFRGGMFSGNESPMGMRQGRMSRGGRFGDSDSLGMNRPPKPMRDRTARRQPRQGNAAAPVPPAAPAAPQAAPAGAPAAPGGGMGMPGRAGGQGGIMQLLSQLMRRQPQVGGPGGPPQQGMPPQGMPQQGMGGGQRPDLSGLLQMLMQRRGR